MRCRSDGGDRGGTEELKLAPGERGLLSLVPDDPAVRIEPETLQLPNPGVPEVEPSLVAGHLQLDDHEVFGRRLLRGRLQLRHFNSHSVENADL